MNPTILRCYHRRRNVVNVEVQLTNSGRMKRPIKMNQLEERRSRRKKKARAIESKIN